MLERTARRNWGRRNLLLDTRSDLSGSHASFLGSDKDGNSRLRARKQELACTARGE